MKPLRLLLVPAVLALAACATGPNTAPTSVHNDQRSCTHNCNISSAPVNGGQSVPAPVPVYRGWGNTVIYHHW